MSREQQNNKTPSSFNAKTKKFYTILFLVRLIF